ncbi:VasL domain-containing protein [Borreliella bavariensis]|uniref:VasL domain-containing protein n=1 Tax=Borreliella bavariensis TaxID=664662 RepID=UPI001C02BD5E|nr:VasL domain-containing protein [Borreliella bavariensis]
MNKKMFIICIVFALIISCKNDVNSKALETSEQIEQEIKKEFNGLLNILETKDLSKLDEEDTKEIEKQIQELKDKIDKLEAKKTSLTTYSEYEEKIEKIKEKLKGKVKFEDKLKGLEDSLKKKKEERIQKLKEAKQKFEGYKGQVGSATGETQGHQAQNQGQIGQQALKCANELGFKNMTSSNSDTSNMTKEIIENSLKQIEEELQNIGEAVKEVLKKKNKTKEMVL